MSLLQSVAIRRTEDIRLPPQPFDDIFLYLYFCKHYTQYQGIISIVKYNFYQKYKVF